MYTVLVEKEQTLAVSLADIKAHLRIDHDTEDAVLTAYIEAAIASCQERTRRQFITATYKAVLDSFPTASIRLERPPLASITSISYVDPNGVRQTLGSGSYQVVKDSFIGYVVPSYGSAWPSTRAVPGAVEIVYTCGYGAETTDLPWQAVHAVKMLVGHFYENREATGEAKEIPLAVEFLLSQIAVKELV